MTDLPVIGPLVFDHDVVVYLSWVIVAVASYFLFRTRPGLSLCAVGDDPATADAAGIPVVAFRYAATPVGGALAGMAGAYLSIQTLATWQDSLTAGLGWIAFCLAIFSGWRPWRAMLAAYVFGALTTLGSRFKLPDSAYPPISWPCFRLS